MSEEQRSASLSVSSRLRECKRNLRQQIKQIKRPKFYNYKSFRRCSGVPLNMQLVAGRFKDTPSGMNEAHRSPTGGLLEVFGV